MEQVGVQYLHSWRCNSPAGSVYGVRESVVEKADDDTLVYTPKLRILRDVRRPFWVTKQEFRNHDYKKEFEDLEKCDAHFATDEEMPMRIARALGTKPQRSIRRACRSPFLYGADISTETMIKQKYVGDSAGIPYNITVGALDIESDIQTGEINAITYIHQDKIFTSVAKSYMKICDDKNEYVRDATVEDIQKSIDTLIHDDVVNNGFSVELHVADDEVGLITWIFDRIHECKSDFISVWNMCFDIPRIMERLELHGVWPGDVMCHPDVPKDARVCEWMADQSQVDHFTDRWDWVGIAGYSQFIDSMLLYSRLRKASGRESSYSLDAIASKELKDSKIHFGKITDHADMAAHHFCDYVAYNIKDVILLILLDRKCSDVANMVGLSGGTLLKDYSRQTRLVQNYAYAKAKTDGKVPASVSDDMYTEYDLEVAKVGGAVLPPGLAKIGVPIVNGSNRTTQLAIMVNDLDISSSYPSAIRSMNISKETQLSVLLSIDGHDGQMLEDFCTSTVQPSVHSVDIMHRLYGMPDYTEMYRRFSAAHKK